MEGAWHVLMFRIGYSPLVPENNDTLGEWKWTSIADLDQHPEIKVTHLYGIAEGGESCLGLASSFSVENRRTT